MAPRLSTEKEPVSGTPAVRGADVDECSMLGQPAVWQNCRRRSLGLKPSHSRDAVLMIADAAILSGFLCWMQ